MDPGEAEGSGREYLERWPRDRVILGIYPPLSPPSSPALWLRSLPGTVGTPDLTWVRPFSFQTTAFGRRFSAPSRSKLPPFVVGHCAGITPPLSYNTVPYSRICLGNEN